jgi:hypothetical protein
VVSTNARNILVKKQKGAAGSQHQVVEIFSGLDGQRSTFVSLAAQKRFRDENQIITPPVTSNIEPIPLQLYLRNTANNLYCEQLVFQTCVGPQKFVCVSQLPSRSRISSSETGLAFISPIQFIPQQLKNGILCGR